MRNTFKILVIALIIGSCNEKETDKYPVRQADWKSKQANIEKFDEFFQGKTYLPVLLSYIPYS